MNLTTILVGVAAVAYGLYAAWARRKTPEKFRKLEPMKKFWGERGGLAVHFVGYTVVPIVFGVALIVAGVRGGSLF
jgi:hypothetical protein